LADLNATPARNRSKAVSTLAVLNILLGGIRLILSILAIWLVVGILRNEPGRDPDLLKLIGVLELMILWPILVIFALVSIVAGILLIISGMGLWQRRPSSRRLTLVLGLLAGVLASLYGTTLIGEITDGLPTYEGAVFSILGLVIHTCYCVFVFVVLMNGRNAAEFTRQ
jgi:hypothetical protein